MVAMTNVVWVQGATKISGLRSAIVESHTRTGKIAAGKNRVLYGYEVLGEDAVRNSNGKFERTLYYLNTDEKDWAAGVSPATLPGKGRKTPAAKTVAK